jgi:hypothetical protein
MQSGDLRPGDRIAAALGREVKHAGISSNARVDFIKTRTLGGENKKLMTAFFKFLAKSLNRNNDAVEYRPVAFTKNSNPQFSPSYELIIPDY